MPTWRDKWDDTTTVRQAFPRGVYLEKPRSMGLSTPQPFPSNQMGLRPRFNVVGQVTEPPEPEVLSAPTGDPPVQPEPDPAPEPEVVDRSYQTMTRHADLDDYADMADIEPPSNWASLTIAGKIEWLDANL